MTMRVQDFTTTAARLAYTWTYYDVNQVIANDLENGRTYFVRSEGAGAGKMIPFGAQQTGIVSFQLAGARLTDTSGDQGNIAAIGGLLASDSAPLIRADANEDNEVVWVASNSLPITWKVDLPEDFDGSRDVTVLARSKSGGTTDACTASILTSWDAAAQVTDTVTGAASTTLASYTGTIAAADIPDAPLTVTIQYVPAAHTTDTHVLKRLAIRYYLK